MHEVGSTLDLADLYGRLERLVQDAGSQRAFCEAKKITEGYLSEALSADNKPGPKILAAIGVEKEVITIYRVVKPEAECRVSRLVPEVAHG